MKTCKDCYHYECCSKLNSEFKKYPRDFIYSDLAVNNCNAFKDKSLVLDLPCKVGQVCYKVWHKKILEVKVVSIKYEPLPAFSYTIRFNWLGMLCLSSDGSRNEKYSDDIYFTREEAEQALKERDKT